jgi:hypothetical protein
MYDFGALVRNQMAVAVWAYLDPLFAPIAGFYASTMQLV